MTELEVLVIGGGVVGLAVAARLAGSVASLVLLERHEGWGRETSSRNSEVIHSGIYYPPGSLKAVLCVKGRRMLYRFCAAHRVPHRNCGKIIVATNDREEGDLVGLKAQGEANGVEGIELVGRADIAGMEPNVRAVAGLRSSSTGILNAHDFMGALAGEAVASGAMLVPGAEVTGLAMDHGEWEVRYCDSSGEAVTRSRVVVNAAGLGAQAVMRMAGLDPEGMNLRLHLAKGDYFSVAGPKRRMISRLVYPTPHRDLEGLGIHTVVGLDGGFKLGPSVYYVDRIDYTVDVTRRRAFFDDVSAYLPFLEEGDLSPDMSGIRPKLSGPGEGFRDFHIALEGAAPGLLDLCGIESPGLSASMAIADRVAELVGEYLG